MIKNCIQDPSQDQWSEIQNRQWQSVFQKLDEQVPKSKRNQERKFVLHLRLNEDMLNFIKSKLGIGMDKKIKKIEKTVSRATKQLSSLEKADKKRDKVCDLGKKVQASRMKTMKAPMKKK